MYRRLWLSLLKLSAGTYTAGSFRLRPDSSMTAMNFFIFSFSRSSLSTSDAKIMPSQCVGCKSLSKYIYARPIDGQGYHTCEQCSEAGEI